MVATKTPSRQLSRDQLLAMFKEMANVGSVEIKMTVPPSQRSALLNLGVDLLEGKLREVYFFDTPDLALFANGVAVRARRTQASDDDTVVKLRPVQVADLPPEVQNSPNLKVEMDITRGSYVVSASLKGKRPPGEVRAVINGERSLEKLFSKEQRAFFADHAPDGVSWSDLVPLGPALVTVLKSVPPGFGRKMVIEQWHYPGEVPLVELSTKAEPDSVLRMVADASEFVRSCGLSATGPQAPKTRKALEYWAARYTPATT